jgi:hypothetical protein
VVDVVALAARAGLPLWTTPTQSNRSRLAVRHQASPKSGAPLWRMSRPLVRCTHEPNASVVIFSPCDITTEDVTGEARDLDH